MAQVDFSNAVLDLYSGNPSYADKPMNSSDYLNLGGNNSHILVNTSGSSIVSNSSKTIITNTPSKVSILYTGTFTASGTEFLTYEAPRWRVSNVSFSSGDTYSFVIDIEVSGNT